MKKLFMGIAMAVSLAPSLAAADYPDRPITFVVPYAPGGTADALARVIAINLGKKLGQSVVVENKPGASGMIGGQYVARAKPDGYTVLYDATPLSINRAIHNMNFDPAKDLQPLTMVSVTPNILVVPKSSPFKSVEDIVNAAKKEPGKLTFASGGTGTVQFMAGELFRQGWNLDMLHVPYKSGGPAIMATVGGQVDMMFTNISSSLPLAKDGQVNVLTITSAKRNTLLPDTPTVAESGLDGYEVFEWNGMFVPSGTPDDVVNKLQDAVRDVLQEAEVKEKFDSLGAEIVASNPKDFAKFLQKEFAKWEDVVRKAGIQKQ